ncbi:MAG: site-2 protease family protein [bacterium]|nr:site-2 protease family protein [bacterium]
MQEALGPIFGIIIPALAILISITTHEFSHGFAAFLMGDNTAKDQGRLTLNPLAHIDPFGTILFPALLMMIGAPVFGWAKPVPFNPYNLNDQRYGSLKVGIAGPLANFLIFLVAGILLSQLLPILTSSNMLIALLRQLVLINFVLMMFNLIPIPPLDGSKVLFGLLPPRLEHWERWLEQYGMYILLFVLFIEYTGFPVINTAIWTSFQFMTRLLGIPMGV